MSSLILSRVYDQKLAASDEEAIKILRGISPVAWRNINLIGNFDFTGGHRGTGARYSNPDFWRRAMQEEGDDGYYWQRCWVGDLSCLAAVTTFYPIELKQ